MVFSDLLPLAREAFTQSQPVICHVSVGSRDGELRLTLQRLEPIDVVLAREGQGIRIRVAEASALARLGEICAGFRSGKGKVTLAVALTEDHEAELALPGGYALSLAERQQLSLVAGVLAVEMA